MAKKDLRDSSGLPLDTLILEAEEKLKDTGIVSSVSSDDDNDLKAKVQDTLDYYANEPFIWAVEDGTCFLPKDLHYAHNYAKSKGLKLHKIER